MCKVITPICAVLVFAGTGFAAQAHAKGELQVTAVVQSSATWVQGPDGAWTYLLANAPGAKHTLASSQEYTKPNSSVNVILRKGVSTPTSCHTPKMHEEVKTGRCDQ